MSQVGPITGPRDPGRIRADARIGILQARRSSNNPAGPFADLTWAQQQAANAWLFKFYARWGNDFPPWRRAILIGVAKRLAKNPPPPGWGLSMLRRGRRNKAGVKAMQQALEWKRAWPALLAVKTVVDELIIFQALFDGFKSAS